MTDKKHAGSLVTFLVLMFLFIIVFHRMTYQYLLAVFMGGVLALLAHPLHRRLTARRLGPKTSSTIVTLGIILLVLGPLSAFTVMTIRQGMALGEKFSQSEELSPGAVADKVTEWNPVRRLFGSDQQIERTLRTQLRTAAKFGGGLIVGLAAGIPDFLLQLALAALTCFFFLIDGRRFVNWLLDKLPLDHDVRTELVGSFKNTAVSSIWAGLAAAGSQAAMMVLAFLALGVPGAIFAGGVTFILSWVPVVGAVPTWAAGTVYLFTQGEAGKAAAMIAIGLVTGVVDNIVRPWVLKGRDDMHPLASLLAIIGGIQMFGLMGVFVGPILLALLVALLDTWPEVGRRYGLTFDSKEVR